MTADQRTVASASTEGNMSRKETLVVRSEYIFEARSGQSNVITMSQLAKPLLFWCHQPSRGLSWGKFGPVSGKSSKPLVRPRDSTTFSSEDLVFRCTEHKTFHHQANLKFSIQCGLRKSHVLKHLRIQITIFSSFFYHMLACRALSRSFPHIRNGTLKFQRAGLRISSRAQLQTRPATFLGRVWYRSDGTPRSRLTGLLVGMYYHFRTIHEQ